MMLVHLGLGSNEGDRLRQLHLARRALGRLPATRLEAFSPIYETAPVGPVSQGAFLNAAAAILTALDPYELLDALAGIETRAGRPPRHHRQKWGPRPLDLDVLLIGNQVLSTDELVVPHPLMHERWFVLKPLADIAPRAVHPLLEMSIAELLSYLPDQPARVVDPGPGITDGERVDP